MHRNDVKMLDKTKFRKIARGLERDSHVLLLLGECKQKRERMRLSGMGRAKNFTIVCGI